MDEDKKILTAAWGTTRVGAYWDTVDAPSPFDQNAMIRLGVPTATFRIAQRTNVVVGQYFGIVRLGLMDALHLFRGVRRPMKYRDDMKADGKVMAYVWRPKYDFERDSRGFLQSRTPPEGRVFVVLARADEQPDGDGISGSILRWNWVDADEHLIPVDREERYDDPVWLHRTRSQR